MPLLTVKSFVFGCHNAKWALILLKKLFFTKRGQKFALAVVKTWLGVGYGQGLEMAPWSVNGVMGHFTNIFAPKLMTLFFNLLRQNAIDIQNRPLCG